MKMKLGDRINSRYTVLRFLGRGAMASVFEALDTRTNQCVAIKIITKEDLGSAFNSYFVRLRQEARILRRLSAPNVSVASFIDFQKEGDGGAAYIVMQLLKGESLRSLLDRVKKLPRNRAFHIASEVAKTIAHANEMGVIHRDIKPDNIIIADNGRVYVVDFGIAKLKSPDTRTRTDLPHEASAVMTQWGQMMGTPAYISIHQRDDSQNANSSDEAWSICSVLYEMLTGVRANPGDDAVTVLYNLGVMPPRLDLDEQAWTIISRGLNYRNPYPSVRQLYEDLAPTRAAVSGIRTHTQPTAQPAKPSAKKPPQPASLPKKRSWLRMAGNVAFVVAVNAIPVLWNLYSDGNSHEVQQSQSTTASPTTTPNTSADAGQTADASRPQAEPVPTDRRLQVAWLRRNAERLSADRLRRWCRQLRQQQNAVPGTEETNLPQSCTTYIPARRPRRR